MLVLMKLFGFCQLAFMSLEEHNSIKQMLQSNLKWGMCVGWVTDSGDCCIEWGLEISMACASE